MLRRMYRLASFVGLFALAGSCHAATLSIGGGVLTFAPSGTASNDSLTVAYDINLLRYTFSTTTDVITAVPAGWSGAGTATASGPDTGVTSISISVRPAGGVTLNSFGHPITVTGANDTTLTGQDLPSFWALTGPTAGTLQAAGRPLVTFSGVASLKGGSALDQFALGVGVNFTGLIDGGGGTNALTGPASPGLAVTFNITGGNQGSLTSTTASLNAFYNIQNLIGGTTAVNTFTFGSSGTLSGTVTAASALDQIDASAFNALINLQLRQLFRNSVTPVASFSNMSNFVCGAGLGQITGANATNVWNITGLNSGNVNGVNFTNCSIISGGTGDDTFNIGAAAAVNSIIGNGGNDTIVAPAMVNRICTFQMTSQNNGFMTTPTNPPFQNEFISNYSGIANVTAGASTGTGETDFVFNNNKPLTGTLTAGCPRDKLDFTNVSTVQVFLETQTVLSQGNPYLNISGFLVFAGSGSASITGANTTNAWTITGPSAGTVNSVRFTGFNGLVGGTGTDTFTMNVGATINSIDGGTGTNTLIGPAANNEQCVFAITNSNTGNLNTTPAVEAVSNFTNIGNLTGGATTGTGETDFKFFTNTSLSGTVTGGTVRDKLDLSNFGAVNTVNLQTKTVLNGSNQTITLFNTVSVFALNFGTIIGPDTTNTWALSGNNSGVINNSITFTSATTLNGGAGNDTFTMGVGARIGTINGVSGIDTIVGPAATNNEICTFIVNNTSSGNMSTNTSNESISSFSNITNLTAGAMTGTGETDFRFTSGGSLTGTVTGTTTRDKLDLTLFGNARVNLQTKVVMNFSQSFTYTKFATILNLAASSGVLTGPDATNTWNVTGNSVGTINGINFTGFGSLVGGIGDDTFNIGIGGQVNSIAGTSGNDTIVGPAATNNEICTITVSSTFGSLNSGAENIGTFSGIANLTGGAMTGTGRTDFRGTFSAITGTVKGGTVRDRVDLTNVSSARVDLQAGQVTQSNLTPLFFVQNISNYAGNFGTLIGANTTNAWAINSGNAGTVNGISFTGYTSLVGGTGADTFTMGVGANYNSINGTSGNDTLVGPPNNNTLNLFQLFSANNSGTFQTSPSVENISSFSNIPNLTGGATTGTGHTEFKLFSTIAFTGKFTGGTAADILDYTNSTLTGVTVNLQTLTATGTGGIANLSNFVGRGSPYTLIAPNTNNVWNITSNFAGTVNAVSFLGFDILVGGTGTDAFTIGASGNVSSINGGPLGPDTIDVSAASGINGLTIAGAGTLHGSKGGIASRATAFDNIDTITPTTDLTLAQSFSRPTSNTGDLTTFTITLTNTGSTSVTSIVVNDTLPSNFILQNSTPSRGAYASGVWNVGALGGNTSATLTLVGLATVTGTFVNTATIASATIFDTDSSNNTASSTAAITPGAPVSLAFGQQPLSGLAGANFSPAPTVQVLDFYGNLCTSNTSTVNLAFGTNPTSATLVGTTSAACVGGVATFNSLTVQRSGAGYTLVASDAGLSTATSSLFTINPTAAHHLAINQQPQSTIAGAALSPAVTVQVLDSFGNLCTTDNTSVVSLGFSTNPGGSTLSGATSVTVAGGVATFSTLSLNRTGTGYTLNATDGALIAATTNPFDVSPGAPTSVAFLQQPTNATAGVTLAPAVTARILDSSGNVCTGSSAAVSVAFVSNPGGATLGGTLTQNAVSGVATFANLSVNLAGSYSLQATSAGVSAGNSGSFAIVAAAPDHLTFDQLSATGIAGQPLAPSVTVTVRDIFENACLTNSAAITVAIVNNPGSATLSGTLTINALAGTATFSTLSLNKTGVGYTLKATGASATQATSTGFSITPAVADHLAFMQQPSATVAGQNIAPAMTVQVLDTFGNLCTADTSAVTLSIASNPGTSTLSGTLTANAAGGVATFNAVSLNHTGTGYTLTAVDAGLISATSLGFDISPAAPASLAFLQQPTNATAGVMLAPAVTVRVFDSFGNVCTGSSASVSVAFASNPGGAALSGTLSQNAVSGIATFANLSVNLAGNYALQATSSGLSAGNSGSFAIVEAGADHLTFEQQPTTAIAGAALTSVTVAVRDIFGNPCLTNSAAITLAFATNPSSATLSGTLTVNAVSGTATFATLSINKTGTGYILNATSPTISGVNSSPFSITPAAPEHLAFVQQPTVSLAGQDITPAVTVEVRDAFDNLCTSDASGVTLALSSNAGGAVLLGTVTRNAAAGVATFNAVKVTKTAAVYTLIASDGALTGATSMPFLVMAAPVDHLAFTQAPPNGIAGVTLTPATNVTLLDAFNNVCDNQIAPISLTLLANPGNATLSGTATVMTVNGVATFSTLSLANAASGYTLAAATSGVTGSTSTAFSITPAAISAGNSSVSASPSSVPANGLTPSTITVTLRDAFSNPLPGKTVTLATNAGTALISAPSGVSDAAGVVTFTVTNLTTETSVFSATDASDGTALSATATVIFAPNVAAVVFSNLSYVYDGTAKSATVATQPAGLSVTVTYNGGPVLPTNAGAYAVAATVTDPNFTGSASTTLNIVKAVPSVTWPKPAAIIAGTALDSTQLNAIANVPGTFSYTPVNGTVLGVGSSQTLSASFTPTDSVNFSTLSVSNTIDVINFGPALVSPATALPATVKQNQITALSVGAMSIANSPLSYAWDFGDGTSAAGSVTQHAYSAKGTFVATVTITDGFGASIASSVSVTVVEAPTTPPAGGVEVPFPVTNANGIPDEMVPEATAAGLYYTPSVVSLPNANLRVRLSFVTKNKDVIVLKGAMVRNPGFTPSGKPVVVDIGGVVRTFVLKANAHSSIPDGAFTLSLSGKSAVSPFVIKLTGDYKAMMATHGLTSEIVKRKRVNVPIGILIDGYLYVANPTQLYTAPSGRFGTSVNAK